MILGASSILLSTLMLSGCGGSDVSSGSNNLLVCDLPLIPDSTGSMCVEPPPIDCAAPTVPNETNDACVVGENPNAAKPVFTPAEDQAVLYFNRATAATPTYEGWRLHTWNNSECDAYSAPDTDWADGRVHDGVDPVYGAYWILDLKAGYAGTSEACGNFIMHKGTSGTAGTEDGKELGGGDFMMPLSQDNEKFARMNFVFSGEAAIFEFPVESLGPKPVKIEGLSAHWLDANTLLWDPAAPVVGSVKLHYSASGDLKVNVDTGLNGTVIDLEEVLLTEKQMTIAPYLNSMRAYQGNWSAEEAKAILKNQVYIASYNNEGSINGGTGIQIAKAIDQLYTTGEDDADEAQLGIVYDNGTITTNVWAPTAQNVQLKLYNADKTLAATNPMAYDDISGVWSYEGGSELDRQLYRFEITVYHPISKALRVLNVTDPYSVSLSTDSRFSQFVNLNDEDLKPEGWDDHVIPTIINPVDAVIYEGHIRDFSALDESTAVEYRGKYMAFVQEDTAPVNHLKTMVENGLTHFHMLPVNDIATINEAASETINLYNTIAELCALNRGARICSNGAVDQAQVILDYLEDLNTAAQGAMAQEIVTDMSGVDEFNWGYDPFHFNTPEGSYATNPDGVTRIKEMRAMNQALHTMGLRVVMDVVYNHTNASGVFDKSVLDKVVPGYYHRYNPTTGDVERSTCCDNTATENKMMEKLTVDSLVMWSTHYKYDGFRFDLMGHMTKASILASREAVQLVDDDTYFYGEGWNFGEVQNDALFEQARQRNMDGTGVGTFNDIMRDQVQDGMFFFDGNRDFEFNSGTKEEAANGFRTQQADAQDRIKMGFAGTLENYVLKDKSNVDTTTSGFGGYAQNPADIINYVSVHDEETLWDKFQETLPLDYSLHERVRAQLVAQSIPMLSQGIPFFNMGSDLLRSKSMDRDSFNSGDWFNRLDFTKEKQTWNVGLPVADKNAAKWDEIAGYFTEPDRGASMSEIEYSSAVFNEFMKIRSTSNLFRLTTGQDIMQRVGFHNLGSNQQLGLIVASIDDGVTPDSEVVLADLDPNLDAIVIVVNATSQALSQNVPTATGFSLHQVQANSADETVRGASFTEGIVGNEGNGTFTVPAMTTAVFIKPQGNTQGYGLAANATAGTPEVVPYGSTEIYLRGSMNDWSATQHFVYQGEGIYTSKVALDADTTYTFKIADADWQADTNFGGNGNDTNFEEMVDKGLVKGGNDLTFTPIESTTYRFILDANEKDSPSLTVLDDRPFANTAIYLRGIDGDWSATLNMTYAGQGIYVIDIPLTVGQQTFKIADADWSAESNFGAQAGVELSANAMLSLDGGNDIVLSIDTDGTYVFTFDANETGNETLGVYSPGMYDDTEVFVRGNFNGWSTDNMLTFNGRYSYSAEVVLPEGDMIFKIASEDWSTVNKGEGKDGNKVFMDKANQLQSDGGDMQFTVPVAGTYIVELEGPNSDKPAVIINRKVN